MRQFESMLKLYHLLPSRTWVTLPSLHEQCLAIGIECSSHTLRRWLKAWVSVGFVEERSKHKSYQYRQSRYQPFITNNQDTVLLYWLSRFFTPLLPENTEKLLTHRVQLAEEALKQSLRFQDYLHHIVIELPILPNCYLSTLTPLKHAMVNQHLIHGIFIGQSLNLWPQALVLNSQGWWLRYQHHQKGMQAYDEAHACIHVRSLLELLWVDVL